MFWTTSTHQKIPIEKLDVYHLTNIIKCLKGEGKALSDIKKMQELKITSQEIEKKVIYIDSNLQKKDLLKEN